MRPQPTFPAYRHARPPTGKRWLATGATVLLLTGGIAALLRHPEAGYGQVVMVIGFITVLSALVWGLRVLFYRMATHNAQLYHHEVKQVQQQWWARHCQHIALTEAVLIGPAGTTLTQWQRLINRDHRQPDVRIESGGKALRLLHSFAVDITEREKHLAKTLVLQWREQHQGPLAITPLRCYWSGSVASWLVFSTQMALSFPDVVLPAHPVVWRGEESMTEIIDELTHSAPESFFLCAGCCSLPASHESRLPAGEAAVLWLLGQTGKVQFSRGEVYNPSPDESIVAVAQRALDQSELTQPPDTSFLFSQPPIPDLNETGWNVTQHVQDLNWGELAEIESMVAQTLAAFFAEHHAMPCGWLARDPNHTLALGIVKPYGSGK
ncbi:hypothetical protein [Yersinia proxima]|uniref:hypothetical protein n=1 Tax=Yersinia TaxID=629 RepID=UPI0005E8BAC6|nr:hypothetical protein [Yersinia proxima]PNM26340.1 hypothetical protein A6J66_020560 [Yersinia enterocolitica]CNM02306.1 Uncharacterised protein [Yersinia intermedia]